LAISEQDDRFHFDRMSNRWWETETVWFSFCHPQRKLGGWLYTMVRPNIGTVAGGTWIWDEHAHLPWEVPYYTNYTSLRLPADADARDIAFPNGVTVKAIEALRKYELKVEDEGKLSLNLIFEAIMAPQPLAGPASVYGAAGHFDQYGRMKGSIILHGEEIAIDCLAIRDRSWGPRAEHRPPRSAYVTGISSCHSGFLAVTSRTEEHEIAHGFLLSAGVVSPLKGHRTVKRCPRNGWVTDIVIEGRDEMGRNLEARGRRLSGIIINRHTFIDSNGLIEWTINGEPGHGEDQDMWPVHSWSAFRRAARMEAG
jgi:hypothetical protein